MKGWPGGYTKEVCKGEIVVGTKAINITSMEYKGSKNTLDDYEITSFLHGQENKLLYYNANEELINLIKEKFQKYNLKFRNYCKWRYLE